MAFYKSQVFGNPLQYKYIYIDGKKYLSIYYEGKRYFNHKFIDVSVLKHFGTDDYIVFRQDTILTLPITQKTFLNWENKEVYWEIFSQTDIYLIPQFDGGNNYYFDCVKSFTGSVFIDFQKTYLDGNASLMRYQIFENSIMIFDFPSGESNPHFANTTTVNFVAGKYYEFAIYADGRATYLTDLKFTVNWLSE